MVEPETSAGGVSILSQWFMLAAVTEYLDRQSGDITIVGRRDDEDGGW